MELRNKLEENYIYLRITAYIFLFVYFMLFVLLGRVLLNLDESTALVLMIVGIFPVIVVINEMTERKINAFALLIAGLIMVVGKILYTILLDPLTTLDATRYYAQVILYQNNFAQFFDFFWEEFTTNHVMSSAYPSFGIIYIPFYILFNTDNAFLIVILNTISLILIAYFSYLITKKNFWQVVNNNELFLSLIFAGVLISPTLMFWSSTFSKDVFSILIAIIALYFLLNKRYILFFIFLVYATMLRPYSIAIILIYFAFYKGTTKVMWAGILGSLAIVAYNVGLTGVINTFNTMVYLIASPNPLSLENWNRFFLLEIEIILILIMLALSIYVFVNKKESRKFYLLALSALFIYSCVMTMVGFGVIDSRDEIYSLGSVGDDISRKKLPIIVLYYTVISYTIVNLKSKLRN